MDQCCRLNVMPLLYFTVINLLLVAQSDGRYLRPSDHGLSYQEPSAQPSTEGNAPPGMLSFFNGGRSSPSSLPEARNFTGGVGGKTWWNDRERRRSRDAHKRRVREILLVTSLFCGFAGVVLLAASAFVFVVRYRKQQRPRRQQPPPPTLPPPQQLGLGVEWSKQKSLSTRESTSALTSDVSWK